MVVKTKRSAKKQKKNIVSGVVHINSTFNNIITITDLAGDTIAWSSAGSVGFKGARKVLPLQLKQLQKQRQRLPWVKDYVK